MDRLSPIQSWRDERKHIAEAHETRLDSSKEELNKAKEAAYKSRDAKVQEWQARFTPDQYAVVAPTLDEILQGRLQEAERIYRDNIAASEKVYRKDLKIHHNSFDHAFDHQSGDGPSTSKFLEPCERTGSRDNDASSFSNAGSPDRPEELSQCKSASQDLFLVYRLTKPAHHTAGYKVAEDQGRMLPYTKKRDIEQAFPDKPKRPRIEIPSTTGECALRTPTLTPQSGAKQLINPTLQPAAKPSTNRITTFNDVTNDPNHKDYIVEFPPRSGIFFILYCQTHNLHFSQNPIMGAAAHLNGRAHGYPSKHHNLAVEKLGYHVIDCNHKLARQHNEMVDRAYENGYKPINQVRSISTSRRRARQNASLPTGQNIPPTTRRSSERILDPKPHNVYCAYWPITKEVYPVLILGWDSKTEPGLDKLVDPSSHPPSCYIYYQRKIISWAPGYEDGGSKVGSRQFPVRWFDGENSVGWVEARHLEDFSTHCPRNGLKKYFDSARDWISQNRVSDGRPYGTEMKRTEPETSEFLGGGESYFSSSDSFSDDILKDDPELARLAAKGGNDSNDEDYESSDFDEGDGSDTDMLDSRGSRTVYRQSFFNLRRSGDHGHTPLHNEVPIQDPKSNDQSGGTPATAQFGKMPIGTDRGRRRSRKGFRGALSLQRSGSTARDSHRDTIVMTAPVGSRLIRELGGASAPAKELDKSMREPVGSFSANGVQGLRIVASSEPLHNPEDDNHSLQYMAMPGSGKVAGIPKTEAGVAVMLPSSREPLTPQSHTDLEGPLNSKLEELKMPVVQPLPDNNPHHDTDNMDGPIQFELSRYTSGTIEWTRSNPEETCIQLFYSTDMRSVLSKGDPIGVRIDTTALSNFVRESDEEENGNGIVKLIYKDPAVSPAKLVFDRSEGSEVDMGKKQARHFISWLRRCDVRPV